MMPHPAATTPDHAADRRAGSAIASHRPADAAVEPHRVSAALAARGTGSPPAVAPLAILVVGYLSLVAGLVAVGALITHGAPLAPVRAWDDDITHFLADHRTASLDGMTALLSRSADTMSVVALAGVVEIVLLVQRRWWALIVTPLALGLELATFLTVNSVVGRPRPDAPTLGTSPSTASFPSGHTAATVVLWGAVVVLWCRTSSRRVIRDGSLVVPAALVVAVGFARVYRGMHHPTDVMFGALMGLAALAITILAVRVLVALVEARRDPTDPTGVRPVRTAGATS